MKTRRRVAVLTCAAALILAFAAQPAYAAGPWNLADDYLARGDATGPWAKDADGNTVWYFKYAPTAPDPGTFVALDQWTTTWDISPTGAPTAGLKGWEVLAAAAEPHVAINGTGGDVQYYPWNPITWPAGAVKAHPGPDGSAYENAVIEWKSPVSGTANATIGVNDLDTMAGRDGVECWILKNSTVLWHEAIAEGGGAVTSLAIVDEPVVPGDSFYLVIGPAGTGPEANWYDSTRVNFQVTVEEPPPAVSTPASSPWSLALMALIGLAALPVIRRVRATA